MIDPKTIDDLKAKHGEIHLLKHDIVEVVVKSPDRASWKRFRTMQADESRRIDAPERLFKDCCVHPDPAGVEALLDKRPGLAETFGGECAQIAGLSSKATTEKL